MVFDLREIDFTKDVTKQLKKQHYTILKKMADGKNVGNYSNRKVMLFYGVNLYLLNEALLRGLDPHLINREYKNKAYREVLYLTRKWHYLNASNICKEYSEILGTETLNTPCYLECEVYEKNLLIDDRFLDTEYIQNRIRLCITQGQPILEISFDECIRNHATLIHVGKIERENINRATIFTQKTDFITKIIKEGSQYIADYKKWSKGKGKGILSLADLFAMEADDHNIVIDLKDIPQNKVVKELAFNKSRDRYYLVFDEPGA